MSPLWRKKIDSLSEQMNRLLTLRNGFYSIGILNVIEILQTIPFFPTYEGNPWFRQYPYILFPYKIVMFVILVPFVFPKVMEKYGEGSDLTTRILRFSLYLMAIVGNLMFLYIVILNTITILGILNIL